MNKFFKKFVVNLAAFGLVMGAFATSSYAADSTITGGSLSMTQPTIGNFAGVTLNGKIQTTTADLGTFSVADATGTGNGWNVSVKASQLTDSVKSLTLPTSSIGIAAPTVTAQAGASDLSTITVATGKIDTTTGVKLLSAALNGGMGTYDVAFPTDALELTLNPKDVKAGTYTSTVTVTVTTGP